MAPPRPLVRHVGPTLLAVLFGIVVALNIAASWILFGHLNREAQEMSLIFGQVFAGLSDTVPDGAENALFELAATVEESGIPVVVTDLNGSVTAWANLPFDAGNDTARVLEYAADLDRGHAPVEQPGIGSVHYGSVPVSFGLKLLTIFEALALVLLVSAAVVAYRVTRASTRDQLWVSMARETAHQMGTPLMSLSGWVEHLRESTMPAHVVSDHIEVDLELLERVASRFERIGRPAKREVIGLGALAERVAGYFQRRLPQLAHRIDLEVRAQGAGPNVRGDRVLLEWALEALVRNAVDVLSGRGGRFTISVAGDGAEGRIRVIDDGPGVPWELISGIFEPGVSSKTGGWGIGLALAQRIIEDQHGGHLALEPSDQGAVFTIVLPTESPE